MIQLDLFIPEEELLRSWEDDVVDWWNFCDNWKPVVGEQCLINTCTGFCIEDDQISYCCFDEGIITEVIENKRVTVEIVGRLPGYFKEGKHYIVDYYEVHPKLY